MNIEGRTHRPLGAISPLEEMGAYEWLWQQENLKPSFKAISEFFEQHPDALPSDLVPVSDAVACAKQVMERLHDRGVSNFGIRMLRAGDYPDSLTDAKHPLQLLYFQGDWELVYSPRRIAIVGTRKPSPEGVRRTKQLTKALVADDFTIVSGLATGVDTAAHQTAIDLGGRTIGVIGTPLHESYPRENADLQRSIAREHLLISQIPVLRYEAQDYRRNRMFFPERNVTMSALTQATVIVEAGETSGTLIQAKAALEQGRKLFILESNFNRPSLTWPARFERLGAIRVRDYRDIQDALTLGPSRD
ncbi:MAG TPA: DNA-processing protein DprA [Ramlibacter sp.]|jgi:DNA processing protein|nr:DNA-processing protein DprA [Ramlibacter sp.]